MEGQNQENNLDITLSAFDITEYKCNKYNTRAEAYSNKIVIILLHRCNDSN